MNRGKLLAAALLLGLLVLPLGATAVTLAQEGAPAAGSELPEVGSGTVEAADPVASGQVSAEAVARVARELNCPLCQGYNLQDCPLTVCAQMRALIAQQLADGMAPEAVMAGFVDQYGPQVLNAPPTQGGWILVWLTPALLLAIGLSTLGLSWRRRRTAPASNPPELPGRDAAGDAEQASVEAAYELDGYAERFAAMARGSER